MEGMGSGGPGGLGWGVLPSSSWRIVQSANGLSDAVQHESRPLEGVGWGWGSGKYRSIRNVLWSTRLECFESYASNPSVPFSQEHVVPPAEYLLVDAVLHFNVTEPRSCPLAVSGYSSTPHCLSTKIMLSTCWVPVSGQNSTLHCHSAKVIIMVFTCSIHVRQF